MSSLHFLDSSAKFLLIELKKRPGINMIAIFKHEGRKQHKSDIKKVDFIAITVIDTGKAVLMYEPYLLRCWIN